MRRSIGKLDSSKHPLDEVGASDASNRGKSVSWVHSSACERSIGNACVQKKKYFLLRLRQLYYRSRKIGRLVQMMVQFTIYRKDRL